MLSKKAKYAIRAMIHLAARQGTGPVMIKDIAQEERIPKKFLEAILVDLKNGGMLKSRAGKGGGYEMATPASDIDLGEIIRKIDGPLALTPCASKTAFCLCDDCPTEKFCTIQVVMREVRNETARVLEGKSLESLVVMAQSGRPSGTEVDFNI